MNEQQICAPRARSSAFALLRGMRLPPPPTTRPLNPISQENLGPEALILSYGRRHRMPFVMPAVAGWVPDPAPAKVGREFDGEVV